MTQLFIMLEYQDMGPYRRMGKESDHVVHTDLYYYDKDLWLFQSHPGAGMMTSLHVDGYLA